MAKYCDLILGCLIFMSVLIPGLFVLIIQVLNLTDQDDWENTSLSLQWFQRCYLSLSDLSLLSSPKIIQASDEIFKYLEEIHVKKEAFCDVVVGMMFAGFYFILQCLVVLVFMQKQVILLSRVVGFPFFLRELPNTKRASNPDFASSTFNLSLLCLRSLSRSFFLCDSSSSMFF